MTGKRGTVLDRVKSNAKRGTKMAMGKKATKIVKSGILKALQASLESKSIENEKIKDYLAGAEMFFNSTLGEAVLGMGLSTAAQQLPFKPLQENEDAQDIIDSVAQDAIANAEETATDFVMNYISPELGALFQGLPSPPKKRIKVKASTSKAVDDEDDEEEVETETKSSKKVGA